MYRTEILQLLCITFVFLLMASTRVTDLPEDVVFHHIALDDTPSLEAGGLPEADGFREVDELKFTSPLLPQNPSVSRSAKVTILTGTHFGKRALGVDERKQSKRCRSLANALYHFWAAWDVRAYQKAKSAVRNELRGLRSEGGSCTLSGSRDHDVLWTFPLSWRPDSNCDARMNKVILSKSYIREQTKVYVNWFLLRPDLVTFTSLASIENVQVQFAVSVGNDPKTAAFAMEGCPRFNTVLEKRDIYKQRLLLVHLSDVQKQLDHLESSVQRIHVCGTQDGDDEFAQWMGSAKFSKDEDDCSGSLLGTLNDKSHLGSMLKMRLFQGSRIRPIPKTVFTGPRLIFVAGLEGVGHHVFALLGRKHTTRELYDGMTAHLCDSAWDDESESKYAPTRELFVQAMRQIKDPNLAPPDGSDLFFLNTVYTIRDVNMYSFPWGGPRCYLKRYARVLCNIDLVELCRMAEEAGVDFRVVHLKRSIGAAVVSASLHRPFGTLVSETRMLALSDALLEIAIDTIDERFNLEINYEDMINRPEDSVAKLAEHLGFDESNELYAHFVTTLKESAAEHPVGEGSKWKEEVDAIQLQYMVDVLGM